MGALATDRCVRRLTDALLRPGDDRGALIGGNGRTLTHDEVANAVERRLEQFGFADRSLVLVEMTNDLDSVISYLALLHGGHVPILAATTDTADRLAGEWSPHAIVRAGTPHGVLIERLHADPIDLHDELALLLSTSGSTGSPKLVRLSHGNLIANAESIVEYLSIDASDVGITTLPLHYSYGLSVLHSHLLVGATVVVTDLSVVDPCFRQLMTDREVTNLAGVPHTYELLERVEIDRWWPRSLRQLTQAGGRMAPEAVTRWADRADRHDAELFVMYGQTEATARIAFLPPHLASVVPSAIGNAIPGGELSLRPVDGHPTDVGELVYCGPNVMMGYATESTDLAKGAELGELATGDLARCRSEHGVYEIVGRRSRFVKPFGLRIDLDHVEQTLRRELVDELAVAGDDNRVVVVTARRPEAAATAIRRLTGLPVGSIVVHEGSVPRTGNGKVDHAAILCIATTDGQVGSRPTDRADAVVAALAPVAGNRSIEPSDTFVSLGGDSLSYVECSIRLEEALGELPRDWHLLTVAELAASVGARRRLVRVDTTVVLRAVAICLVVSTHMRLRHLPGGAHTLLAVAGYNFARFVGSIEGVRDRVVAGLRTAARVAAPAMAWTLTGMLVFGAYSTGTVLLVNNYVGPRSHAGDHWHFWFIEVFVHVVVIATLLLAVPAVRRLERRHQYVVPAAVLGVSLLLRMEWAWAGDWYNLRFRTHGVAWFFALGWLIHASRTTWQRALTTGACLLVVPGFFQIAQRDWRITIALIALVWFRAVPLPRLVVRPLTVLAAASMWIYVSHFTFWPLLDAVFLREFAYLLTVAAGIAVWFAARRVTDAFALLPRPDLRRIVHHSRGRYSGDRDQTPRLSPS